MAVDEGQDDGDDGDDDMGDVVGQFDSLCSDVSFDDDLEWRS